MTPEQLAAREDAAFYLTLLAILTIVIALTLGIYALRVLWKYRDDHGRAPVKKPKRGRRRAPKLSTNREIVMPTTHDTLPVQTYPTQALVTTRVMPQPSPIPGNAARLSHLSYGDLEVTEVKPRMIMPELNS